MKRIQNIFLDLFFLILAKTPKSILYIISDFIYIIVFYISRYRRKTVCKNLKNSFPEKTENDIDIIMKKFYHHLCDITLENAALVKMSKKKVLSFVNFKNPEILKEYYKDNRNVILVFAHYGNWELLSPLPLYTDYPFLPVYKTVNNEFLNIKFYKMRSIFGAVPIRMEDTLKKTLKYHQSDKAIILGLIADQRPVKKHIKYYTDFLNQETPVFLGPERIGKKINAAIIYVNINKEKRGFYNVEFSLLCDKPMETEDYEITGMFNSKLEKTITEKPEFWLWSHDRWKHKRKEKHIYLGGIQ
jgi:KDO2-lipid IV(A) lauroyltransferase